jgi:hypothetical protein
MGREGIAGMIHYHGLPMTGHGDPILAMQARHACVSFAHPDQIDAAAELCQSFILDNGAFSAWKGGNVLDLDGFAKWATKWHRHPGCDWLLMPDVIDGTDEENRVMRATWRNAVPLSVWSVSVPVWHLNERLDTLDELVATYPRVAFGSSGQYATIGTTSWWQRMAEAMEVACDEDGFPRARLHGLRMLDPTVFSHFPFSSADSTNVARNCGIDKAWNGPYAPRSRRMRALIMMERIEAHASASRWVGSGVGASKNHELFG